jgi:hypothetical protein
MEPRTWTTHSADYNGISTGDRFRHFGEARIVRMYGSAAPIVEVNLVEDPEGEYKGWIPAGETKMRMVLHKQLFPMQFPYGVTAEVDAGKGEAVNLRVELVRA